MNRPQTWLVCLTACGLLRQDPLPAPERIAGFGADLFQKAAHEC